MPISLILLVMRGLSRRRKNEEILQGRARRWVFCKRGTKFHQARHALDETGLK